MLAMHILPLRSWSATDKNRARLLFMLETNFPSEVTSEYRLSKLTRGMRTCYQINDRADNFWMMRLWGVGATWLNCRNNPLAPTPKIIHRHNLTLNVNFPLSTPLHSILCPMSWIVTPGETDMSSSRMRTRNAWMPSLTPLKIKRPKTTHHLAWTAELVIQYFCANVEGVWMINSWVLESHVAVVSISTALFPYPNSIFNENHQPRSGYQSTQNIQWRPSCRWIWSCVDDAPCQVSTLSRQKDWTSAVT